MMGRWVPRAILGSHKFGCRKVEGYSEVEVSESFWAPRGVGVRSHIVIHEVDVSEPS